MVLTAITVAVAFINLGALNFPVALGIAILKATLVILFFMHVKYSSRLTKLVCGTAFFFLIVLFGLTMSDYLSRGWFTAPAPNGTTGAGTQVTIGPPAPAPAPAGGGPGRGGASRALTPLASHKSQVTSHKSQISCDL